MLFLKRCLIRMWSIWIPIIVLSFLAFHFQLQNLRGGKLKWAFNITNHFLCRTEQVDLHIHFCTPINHTMCDIIRCSIKISKGKAKLCQLNHWIMLGHKLVLHPFWTVSNGISQEYSVRGGDILSYRFNYLFCDYDYNLIEEVSIIISSIVHLISINITFFRFRSSHFTYSPRKLICILLISNMTFFIFPTSNKHLMLLVAILQGFRMLTTWETLQLRLNHYVWFWIPSSVISIFN